MKKRLLIIPILTLLVVFTFGFIQRTYATNFLFDEEDGMRVEFYGTVIDDDSDYITIKYDFKDLESSHILMNKLVKVSNTIDSSSMSYIPFTNQFQRHVTNDGYHINTRYNELENAYVFPKNTYIEFDFSMFNFMVSGYDETTLTPYNMTLNSRLSSYKLPSSYGLVTDYITFSESVAFSPTTRSEMKDYTISFSATEKKRINMELYLPKQYTPSMFSTSYWTETQFNNMFMKDYSSIFITYFKPTADLTNYYNDYGTNYTDMPYTNGVKSINSITLQNELTSTYNIEYIHGSETNVFQFSFPDDIPLESISANKLYLQLEYGYRKLIFHDSSKQLYEFDLNSMTWNKYNKLHIYGSISKGDNKTAYLNMFLPKTTDYLLSIDLNYRYRTKNLLGLYSSWTTVNETYSYFDNPDNWIDSTVSITNTTPRWHYYIPFLTIFTSGKYDEQTIQEITFSKLDSSVKNDFMAYFQRSNINDFQEFTYWQINLGTFGPISSIGFDITDMVILELTYMDNGDIFVVDPDNIHQEIDDYIETNQGLFEIVSSYTNKAFGFLDGAFTGLLMKLLPIPIIFLLFFYVFKKIQNIGNGQKRRR